MAGCRDSKLQSNIFSVMRMLNILLIVGAYRDNEVNPSHPLMLTLNSIREAGVTVDEIVLQPLSLKDVEQFLADALRCERGRSTELAQLVHKKTAGNPFFAIHFLTALAEEHLLEFDGRKTAWQWDLTQIHTRGFTERGGAAGWETKSPA
jgi:predicted ATPase